MADNGDQAEQGNEDEAVRRALRRTLLDAREKLPPAKHARASAKVREHLYALLSPLSPAQVGFYWPIRAEVDCRALAIGLIDLGWRACLPVVTDRNAAMGFRNWTPDSPMVTGAYGIPTVAKEEGEVAPARPSVLLVPLLAFDPKGYRLGYGGGYYDRTLASMASRPYVVGVGFDLARTDSVRPHAKDCVMDAVVTESGVKVFHVFQPER